MIRGEVDFKYDKTTVYIRGIKLKSAPIRSFAHDIGWKIEKDLASDMVQRVFHPTGMRIPTRSNYKLSRIFGLEPGDK